MVSDAEDNGDGGHEPRHRYIYSQSHGPVLGAGGLVLARHRPLRLLVIN
jgi:hypothetical protein